MKSFSALCVAMVASSAAAFVPSEQSPATTALNAGMPDRLWDSMVDKTERSASVPFLPRAKNLDGSMVGDVGFDPFYLSSIPKDFSGFIQPPQWEEKSLPTLYWMREAELKHCRVAMLAWFGWLATDGAFGVTLRFPGEVYSVENIPSAYFAHNTLVEQGSMAFLLLAVSVVEFCSSAALVQVAKGELDREAGDFGLDPLNFLKDKSEEEKNTMKLKEINNGRLAMLAFGGVCTQAALSDATHNFPYF
jgi:light-harvesting complex I chlorophyll a/b binding protein 1